MSNKNTIQYRQFGDYLIPNLILPPEEVAVTLGKWGQLHLNHLKNHCKSTYYTYLMNCTLHDYLCSVNDQAEEMFTRA